MLPGGDNARSSEADDSVTGTVDNLEDVELDCVRNKSRNGEAKGACGEKPNKPQKNPQLVVRLTVLC